MGNIIRALVRGPDCLLGRDELEDDEATFTGENIAEAMSSCCTIDLHGDILLNILSRLPVKSLLRFRSVCKIWKNIIASPTFINMHLTNLHSNKKKPSISLLLDSHYQDKTSFYTLYRDNASVQLRLPFRRPFCRDTFIAGSSNGLVCIGQRENPRERIIEVQRPFVLWNPATSKFRSLPLQSTDFYLKTFFTVNFAFVPKTADYKLVCVSRDGDEGYMDIETFTLAKNSWTITRIVTNPQVTITTCSKAVNGYLHWLGHWSSNEKNKVVVSFDMSEETFHQTQTPSCSPRFRGRERSTYRSLAVLHERLAMFIYPRTDSSIGECLEIWLTNYRCDATGCWTIYSTIEPLSTSISIGLPIGFWLNGEEIIFANSLSNLNWTSNMTCKNTYLYNPRDGNVRNIPFFQGSHSRKFFPHVDTLVSVKGTG